MAFLLVPILSTSSSYLFFTVSNAACGIIMWSRYISDKAMTIFCIISLTSYPSIISSATSSVAWLYMSISLAYYTYSVRIFMCTPSISSEYSEACINFFIRASSAVISFSISYPVCLYTLVCDVSSVLCRSTSICASSSYTFLSDFILSVSLAA